MTVTVKVAGGSSPPLAVATCELAAGLPAARVTAEAVSFSGSCGGGGAAHNLCVEQNPHVVTIREGDVGLLSR